MSPLVERFWKPVLTYILIPLLALWFLFLVFDIMIMPIFTSHGQEFALPQVVGKSEFEAQQILEKHKLNLQVAGREFSSNMPEGIVLTQLPAAGMPVKSGRNIKVVVSAGVKVSEVPDVIGLPLQQAVMTVQKAGFAVGAMYHTRVDTMPENSVIETIPTRGTPLPLGSRVSLAINQSGEGRTVFMPQLVGIPLERARAILDSLSLGIAEIAKVKDTLYLPHTVLDQSPTRNAPLARGDSVRLTISETD